MEKFIKRAFERLLHMDVKVLFDNEHEDAYQIYVITEHNKTYTDAEFKESSPEFEIFQMHKSSVWVYTILMQTFMGDYWTPPDWDYMESKEEYDNSNDALFGLIQDNLKDRWDDLLMCEEEAKHNDEYLKTDNI